MQAYGKRVFSFDNTDVALRKAAAEGFFAGLIVFVFLAANFLYKERNQILFLTLHYLIRGGFF